RLVDCARSLAVGSTWEPQSVIPPLIHPPRGDLERGLTTLDDGERWALEPRPDPDNPCLWTPGIRWGVTGGAYAHRTEFFGPVLSVMRADNLEHALELANATEYGLTAGIHTLDEREKERWLEDIQSGNCYINRPITGAIVNRQPFGGWKASSFGPGAKAGGPNYVVQLMEITEDGPPAEEGPAETRATAATAAVCRAVSDADRERIERGLLSQGTWWRSHFTVSHDDTRIPGEDNLFRYRPCNAMLLRLGPGADPGDAGLVIGACATAGVRLTVSACPEVANEIPWREILPHLGATTEDADLLCERLGVTEAERIRSLGAVEPSLRRCANDLGIPFLDSPPVAQGRVELLRVTREQSVSHAYHRYGNLGDREALGFDTGKTGP
ncbi:MAG: aldehyde dehydrogenase family protein, partial [Myxococcota bacterium]|nr:aldehyde dehydrogenase family protein [Myxococcota bacterium]